MTVPSSCIQPLTPTRGGGKVVSAFAQVERAGTSSQADWMNDAQLYARVGVSETKEVAVCAEIKT